MIQIASVPNEINASVIKGFLENEGIEASFGSVVIGNNSALQPQHIFVPEEQKEKALELLKKAGLIS